MKKISVNNDVVEIKNGEKVILFSIKDYKIIGKENDVLDYMYLDEDNIVIDISAKWLCDLAWISDPDEGCLKSLFVHHPHLIFLTKEFGLKINSEDYWDYIGDIELGIRDEEEEIESITKRLLGVSENQLKFLADKININENTDEFFLVLEGVNGEDVFDGNEEYLPYVVYKEILKID